MELPVKSQEEMKGRHLKRERLGEGVRERCPQVALGMGVGVGER
jgi:hypothetical protein